MPLNKNLIYKYDTHNLTQAREELSLENSLKRLSPKTQDQLNIETIVHTLTMVGKGIKRLF